MKAIQSLYKYGDAECTQGKNKNQSFNVDLHKIKYKFHYVYTLIDFFTKKGK